MEAFMGKERTSAKKRYVWINGIMTPLDQAGVPVNDLGFQYGYGFFETIKVDKGIPKHLEAHVSRFYNSWEQLFFEKPPDVTWDVIIDQVVNQNQLNDETAAVKFIATRGDREAPPYNYTMIVAARPYTHRLKDKNKRGLDLAIYPEPRQTNLADHKTLNYLYYFLAGKWANAQQADEALILNPDRTISETNTANILCIKNHLVVKPRSPHVLPGVMENVVCEVLAQWGFQVENERVRIEDLFEFDQVMITNALLGAVPVLSIDGKKLPEPSDLCDRINDVV
jgi:para-aminobenzoate synthetase component 1